ncbi:phosphatase PAP2 family protein [Halobacillus yeomjeoni]|uniref:phosphatase PAP2 family protein n=1 Tax=Halobacillus yeomjeoni TaxID=311194 RepID=UPI001CD72394|nr:phosphatase PAP2 family protein [Halobacillus yeomjeoni]MCA0985508.1 phosphatase PAP2 family protein [Halobacillus yeomjeoni]
MDEVLLRWIYDFSEYAWWDQTMFFFSSWGYKLAILFILISLVWKQTRWTGFAGMAALVLGLILSKLLRWLFPRERPFMAIETIEELLPKEATASFPSEQGIIIGVFMSVLWQIGGAWRWIGIVLGMLVMTSRVYVAHHYVSDVLIGAALGILCFMIFHKMIVKRKAL